MNIDKLTINERLIPDEFDPDGGDLIPEGTDRHPTIKLQHTYVTEQPITAHTVQPSTTPCNVNMTLPKFPTPMSQDAPDDHSQSYHTQQSQTPTMDDCHNTMRDAHLNKMTSPGGMMDLRMRPPSPTNLCDFPYYELHGDEFLHQHISLPLSFNTTTWLPRIKVNRADLLETTHQTHHMNENEENSQIGACESYYSIADIGLTNHAFIASKSSVNPTHLADTGANCCMTPNLSSLRDVETLLEPITVGVAVMNDKNPTYAQCTHIGVLPVPCDDGSQILTKCFYNPFASDTILSPQAIIDSSSEFHTWQQTGRKFGMAGTLEFIGYTSVKTITLSQSNGLYYCSAGIHQILKEEVDHHPIFHKTSIPDNQPTLIHRTHHSDPKRMAPPSRSFKPTPKAKILESETWYLRLGACNETQLEQLPRHAIGLPSKLEWHPFRFVDFKEQARIRKRPVGRNPVKVSDRGQRFYMDFGFIRASAADLSRPKSTDDRVVESFDGFNSYLLVVDEVSKYSWIFLTKSKEPPIELTKIFMNEFANTSRG